MCSSFMLLDRKLFELSCKNTETQTHTDSDEYSIIAFCKNIASPGKDQKGSLTPVSQSIQKKTHAMVAQSCEDGEEALCVKVEGTSSKKKLKTSGTEV